MFIHIIHRHVLQSAGEDEPGFPHLWHHEGACKGWRSHAALESTVGKVLAAFRAFSLGKCSFLQTSQLCTLSVSLPTEAA